MMKKWTVIFLPVIIALLSLGTAFGAEEITVYGTLIDTKCYGMNHSNKKDDHVTPKGKIEKCATMCAKMGIPVGLLVDGKIDGKVYFLAVPAPALADYMGKAVRVIGTKAFRDGLIVDKIELMKGDAFEEIEINTMM
ncbi:MAG: hypothetical protein ACUZ8O_06325 [Candidatus Anammoxibacter sp.]